MSGISPATWADLGYGRLSHPQPHLVQSFVTALKLTKFYEFLEDGSGHWARLKSSTRNGGVFIHSGCITAANVGDSGVLEALDTYWWPSERDLPPMPYDRPFLQDEIARSRGYRKLLWMRHLLFCVRPSQYVQTLREVVAPAFFSMHPRGRIHIVRIATELNLALQTIDVLGVMRVYSVPEIRQSQRRSLTGGQSGHLGSAILEAVLSAFHPNLYGLVAERFSFLLVFQCHPRLRIRPGAAIPVLQDALRGQRLLEPLRTRSETRSTSETGSTPAGSRAPGDTRLRHVTRWRAETIGQLVEWTVERINALYLSLLDPRLFLTDEKSVDFIKQRQFYLTIERILSETITVNTEEDTYLRKQLFFDVLDKYATLSARKVDPKQRQRTYLRLLKESHFRGRLEPLMVHMPDPFRAYLLKVTRGIYERTVEEAVDGIWSRDRVDSARRLIQVRKFEKTSERYIDEAPQSSFEDFTAELIHGVRNSLHGYRMMGHTYERLLVSHSGEVSNVLPDLATTFLFVLLCDPDAFMLHTWSKDVTRNPGGGERGASEHPGEPT